MSVTTKLAKAFSRLLLQEIGINNLREAVKRNVRGSQVCRSHDYCDANQVMIDALIEVGIIPDGDAYFDADDAKNDELLSLTNLAWGLARDADFFLLEDCALVGFNNDGSNPKGLYAEVGTSGDAGIYDELRVTVFNRHGVAVGDILIGLDDEGQLRLASTSDGDGNGDHTIAIHPEAPAPDSRHEKPTKVLISVREGRVTNVEASAPIQYLVADTDIEGAVGSDLMEIPSPRTGEPLEVWLQSVENASEKPAAIGRAFESAARHAKVETCFEQYDFAGLTVEGTSGWQYDTGDATFRTAVYVKNDAGQNSRLTFSVAFSGDQVSEVVALDEKGSEVGFMPPLYLAVWGDGFAKQEEKLVSADFFCEANGYREDEIRCMPNMICGMEWQSPDYPSHVVKRIL
ncbi:hypothetical protein [Gulbenkiania mobilis]|uniref:hypothetical protein n=1 Tax=Gulbenkiania mobilis TaxID=397457 RepID=UPI0006BBEFBD|nr:hypothetical protein [Gulbenkiania mobilis]